MLADRAFQINSQDNQILFTYLFFTLSFLLTIGGRQGGGIKTQFSLGESNNAIELQVLGILKLNVSLLSCITLHIYLSICPEYPHNLLYKKTSLKVVQSLEMLEKL